jgi:arylsulfatase A-like enzyme
MKNAAVPVDFMSIYPTLCDLAGVAVPQHVEGVSLRPLLSDPHAAWERPALTTCHRGNHSLRSERWRYIRYADGGEELYDHEADEYEWTNVAGKASNASAKAELAQWLPKSNQDELPRDPPATKATRQRKRGAR